MYMDYLRHGGSRPNSSTGHSAFSINGGGKGVREIGKRRDSTLEAVEQSEGEHSGLECARTPFSVD